MRALVATAGGYPAQVEPGQLLMFIITPANPTGAAVSLTAPAHGRVRFAMRLTIPALTCPAHRVSITWQSPPPGFGPQGPHTEFTIAVTG